MGATTENQQNACFRSSVKYKRLLNALENTGKQNATFLVDGKNNEFFNNFIFGTSLRMYSCMLFFLFPRFHPRFLSYNVKFNINCFKRKAFKAQPYRTEDEY